MTTISASEYLAHAKDLDVARQQLPENHPLQALLATASSLLVNAAEGSGPSPCHDNTRVALIDKGYHWQPIDKNTPKGAKMQLINKKLGVAVYGTLNSSENFFTHWAPLPTFHS